MSSNSKAETRSQCQVGTPGLDDAGHRPAYLKVYRGPPWSDVGGTSVAPEQHVPIGVDSEDPA